MSDFKPLATLPGWEANDGRFALCRCGNLRFLRTLRRIGEPRRSYALNTDTPRAFDIKVEEFATQLAAVAEAAR